MKDWLKWGLTVLFVVFIGSCAANIAFGQEAEAPPPVANGSFSLLNACNGTNLSSFTDDTARMAAMMMMQQNCLQAMRMDAQARANIANSGKKTSIWEKIFLRVLPDGNGALGAFIQYKSAKEATKRSDKMWEALAPEFARPDFGRDGVVGNSNNAFQDSTAPPLEPVVIEVPTAPIE